jgi:hypothetical protein
MGSNPTGYMDVCMRLFCDFVVLGVGSGLATADPPSKESYIFNNYYIIIIN